MVTKYPEIHQQASPHIPQSANYSYVTEQARRARSMGPELGRTQHEHFRDHHHHPHPHPRPFPPPHSLDMHEAIQREIEKERIRDEIIMSEIVRRRVLEAEVRRELMMERELALRRGSNGFPFGPSSVMGFDSPARLPLLGTRAEGRSVEERIVLSLAERERLNGRRESGGFETLPFQRRSADLRISEVKPDSQGGKEKERIILLAKPDENISGSKRKAVTPPPGVDAREFPSDGILRKKAKEEWSCALCQVSATSEQGLNEHLQGKKHKSKEAALRAQRAGKNYSIGLFPKKGTKSIQVLRTVDPGTEDGVKFTSESSPFKKTGEASSKIDDLPLLQENLISDNLKKNKLVVIQKVQKNDDPKKKKYRFWCEMCQVGVSSQKVMNAHKKGKKHVRRLEGSNRNGGPGPSDQKKIVILMNHEGVAEDGKNVASDDVDEALEEAMSEDHEAMDAVKPEDHEPVDETKAEDGGGVDITKPDVADEPKDAEPTVP